MWAGQFVPDGDTSIFQGGKMPECHIAALSLAYSPPAEALPVVGGSKEKTDSVMVFLTIILFLLFNA